MSGIYNPLLVFLSLIVAFLASYTALELSGRIFSLQQARQRERWLLGGAIAMGTGIWSMHFIGMMAFTLPIPVGYDLSTTAASFLLACVVSLLALSTVTRGELSRVRIAVAGTVMGMGIAGMHYTGMAAMQMSPPIRYTWWVVMASIAIAIAIAASIAALWLALTLRTSSQQSLIVKGLGAAIIMALAITGMHYTGMGAANFATGSICFSANKLDANWVALVVSASSLTVLIGTLTFLGLHTGSLSNSLRRANSQLDHLGTHDTLTDLPNRLWLTAHIERAMEACARRGSMIAVLLVNLDGFKTINDSLGRAVGDDFLKTCASRLGQNLRHDDMVARIGGDEFVIVVGGLLDPSVAGQITDNVLRELCREIVINGVRLRVSASIGIAVFPRDGNDVATLLHNADAAMYDAKQSGRNTFRYLTHGLHYASAVFEGERAYGGTIFKGTEHSERLKNSARILDFEIPWSVAEIDAAKQLVLEKNNLPDAYVRPVAWRGSEMMGVSAQSNTIHLAVACWTWPSYFDPAERLKGIRLGLAEYRRPDPATIPALAKAAGLYMICTISKHRAERDGYADAVMLDWQGRVAECTGANIFFIKDGKIHTPIADCFLAGITRATAIDMAKRRGIEVIERRILPEELASFSECFITGTAAEITPVSEIAKWKFKPGAISEQLMKDYTAEVQPKGNAAAA